MNKSKFEINFFSEKTVEQLERLPKSAKKMIKKAILERLETSPNKYGEPLRGNLKNHRRVRVSYYRIVYHVNEKDKIVTIKAIDYRKEVYE